MTENASSIKNVAKEICRVFKIEDEKKSLWLEKELRDWFLSVIGSDEKVAYWNVMTDRGMKRLIYRKKRNEYRKKLRKAVGVD